MLAFFISILEWTTGFISNHIFPLLLGDPGSIPELERSPGKGNGNPLQYSCLENPWTEEPGGLQSMGSQRGWHDCMTFHTISFLPNFNWEFGGLSCIWRYSMWNAMQLPFSIDGRLVQDPCGYQNLGVLRFRKWHSASDHLYPQVLDPWIQSGMDYPTDGKWMPL